MQGNNTQRIGCGNCGMEAVEQKISGMLLRFHSLLVLQVRIG